MSQLQNKLIEASPVPATTNAKKTLSIFASQPFFLYECSNSESHKRRGGFHIIRLQEDLLSTGSSSKVHHETFPPVVSRECPPPLSAWPLQTSSALYLPSITSLTHIPGRLDGVLSNHLPSAILLHIQDRKAILMREAP